MHDPMTVAFDLMIPIVWAKKRFGLRPTIDLVTIWHVDPEADGSDDSCDWFGTRSPNRPRWKHPRWHLNHWKIQIHYVQRLKRYLFSRCKACGKRFSWHECRGSLIGSWNNEGPAWFYNAENVWHIRCDKVNQKERM